MFQLLSLSDLPGVPEVEETGSTFEENARLKAAEYALRTGHLVLADDSGLEVEALGNRPGVLSARYGGSGTDFRYKMAKLLGELAQTDSRVRRARFVCSIAAADETGCIVNTVTGVCNGKIAREPRGTRGFGYDPIFIPDGFDLTFGELSDSVKQEISHRARAFQQIIPFLRDYNAI
jgi:XTP/dITP diphosphohydrolase